jgi:hypothetical protein
MDWVVELFDQRIPELVFEVSTTLPPWQKLSGPEADTTGTAGSGFTVTATVEDVAEGQ